MTFAGILKCVLEMSITASLIAVVVMILRVVTKRVLPKSFIFALWIVVIAKLLIPLSLPSPTSLYNVVDIEDSVIMQDLSEADSLTQADITDDTAVKLPIQQGNTSVQVPDDGADVINPEIPESPTLNPEENGVPEDIAGIEINLNSNSAIEENIEAVHEVKADIISTAGAVYCGIVAVATVFIISIYAFTSYRIGESEVIEDERVLGIMRELKNGEKVKLRLLRGNRSIMIFGILHPTVILPEDYETLSDQELKFLLMHEMEHYYHKDTLWNLLMLLAACVHWFNPLVWISYRLFLCDMETACDARVLTHLPADGKQKFAGVLVSFASRSLRGNTVVTMGFGKNNIRDRVVSVVKYKKAGVIAAVASVLIVSMVVAVFATSKSTDKDINDVTADTTVDVTETVQTDPEETETESIITEPESDIPETEPAETDPPETEETVDTTVAEPEPEPVVIPSEIFAYSGSFVDAVNSVSEVFAGSDTSIHTLTVYFSDNDNVALVVDLEKSWESGTGVKATITGAYNYGNYFDLNYADSLLTGNVHIINVNGIMAAGMIGRLGSYYILKDGLCSHLSETDEYGYYLWAQDGNLHYVKRNMVFEYANDSMDEFAKGFESGNQFYMSTGTVHIVTDGSVSLNESRSYTTQGWFDSDDFVMAKERDEYYYESVNEFVSDYLGEGLHEQLYIDQEKVQQQIQDTYNNIGNAYGNSSASLVDNTKYYSIEGPINVTIPITGPATPPQALFNYNSSPSPSSGCKSALFDPWVKVTTNFKDPNPNK